MIVRRDFVPVELVMQSRTEVEALKWMVDLCSDTHKARQDLTVKELLESLKNFL